MKALFTFVACLMVISNVAAQEVKSAAFDVVPDDQVFFDYFHSPVGFKITLYAENGEIQELEIPKGAPLNIRFTEKTSPDLDFIKEGLPLTFMGDVTIRTGKRNDVKLIHLNADELEDGTEFHLAPPYRLKLSGFRVLVEKS